MSSPRPPSSALPEPGQAAQPSRRRRETLLTAALLALLTLGFSWPLAMSGERRGNWDWDKEFFFAEAQRQSIIGHREWPFWNPWIYGGTPQLAHPESSFLSPSFVLLVLPFGAVIGLKLRLLLGLWGGALGGWALARREGLGWLPASLVGLLFGFGGYLPLHFWIGHSMWAACGLTPWLLLALRARQSRRSLLGIAVISAWMLLEGALYVLLFSSLLALALAALESLRTRRPMLLWRGLAGLALGGALAGVKLLPMLWFLRSFPRLHVADRAAGAGSGELSGLSLFYEALLRPGFGERLPWEDGAYLGAVALALALLGALLAWRRLWPWLLAALGFALVAMGQDGVPGLWQTLHTLPVLRQTLLPARWLYGALVPLALAAGFGAAMLRRRLGRLGAALVPLLVVLVALDLWLQQRPVWQSMFPGPAPSRPYTPAPLSLQERAEGEFELFILERFLAGRGLLNAHPDLPRPPLAARAWGDPDYRGELWLDGAADWRLLAWSPSRIRLQVEPAAGGASLSLNQNRVRGWSLSGPGRLRGAGEVVSAEIEAAGVIELDYQPPWLAAGVLLSLLSTALAVWLYRTGGAPDHGGAWVVLLLLVWVTVLLLLLGRLLGLPGALGWLALGCLQLAVLLLSLLGGGLWLLRHAGVAAGGERLVLSLLTALGLLSLTVLALGQLDLGPESRWLRLTGLLLLAGFPTGLGALRGALSGLRRQTRGQQAWLLLAASPLAVALLMAAAPAVFYDTELYHLGLPAWWAQQRQVGFDPNVVYSGLPLPVELLNLLCLSLGGETLARVLAWAAAPLAVACAWLLLRRLGASASAGLGALLVAADPMLFELNALVKPDGWSAAWLLGATLAVASCERGARWLPLLAGWLAGCGLAAKPSLAGGLLLLLACWLWTRGGLRSLPLFGLGAGLGLAPWLLRTWVQTGSPFYPSALAAGLGSWSHEQATALARDALLHQRLGERFEGLLELPLELLGVAGQGVAARVSWALPVLCLLAALGLRDRRLRGLSLLGLGGVLLRALSSGMTRFGLAAYLLVALAGASALADWPPRRRRLAAGALALLALTSWLNTALAHEQRYRPLTLVTGQLERWDYLERVSAHHAAVRWCNQRLPWDARLLLVGETRRAHLERRHDLADVFHADLLTRLLASGLTAQQVLERLRAEGYSHLLINLAEQRRLAAGSAWRQLSPAAGARQLELLRGLPVRFAVSEVVVLELTASLGSQG